jgi:CRISPR system Cascade subunit CasD
LHFGVRIDQPGRLVVDFHTAHTTDGTQSFVSYRHYLADAVFVVGLEIADDEMLTHIDNAVRSPVFPLYLGRRSCPPEGKVSLGIRQGVSLGDALRSEDWQASPWYQRRAEEQIAVEIVSDAEGIEPGAYQVRDLPLDFAQTHRRYAFRTVARQFEGAHLENLHRRESALDHLKSFTGANTDHDPLEAGPGIELGAVESEAKGVH